MLGNALTTASDLISTLTFCFSFQFFNNALMLGKNSESDLSERLYDLIYELNSISSSVLLSVLPQLEFKLKVRYPTATKVTERCSNLFSTCALMKNKDYLVFGNAFIGSFFSYVYKFQNYI